MAAPGRRWLVPLLVAARGFPARRALHEWAPARDVLLFEHERGRFFAVLGLFCAGQGVFWASLAGAALARPPVPARPPDAATDPGRVDVRSALWRYGLAVGCGAIGKAWAACPPRSRARPSRMSRGRGGGQAAPSRSEGHRRRKPEHRALGQTPRLRPATRCAISSKLLRPWTCFLIKMGLGIY